MLDYSPKWFLFALFAVFILWLINATAAGAATNSSPIPSDLDIWSVAKVLINMLNPLSDMGWANVGGWVPVFLIFAALRFFFVGLFLYQGYKMIPIIGH